jgi:sorbitol-specific phosphotransferase system component IIA
MNMAKKSNAANTETAQYTVIHAVEHDDERFEAGSLIDLNEADAKPLLAVGAIAVPAAAAEKVEEAK